MVGSAVESPKIADRADREKMLAFFTAKKRGVAKFKLTHQQLLDDSEGADWSV